MYRFSAQACEYDTFILLRFHAREIPGFKRTYSAESFLVLRAPPSPPRRERSGISNCSWCCRRDDLAPRSSRVRFEPPREVDWSDHHMRAESYSWWMYTFPYTTSYIHPGPAAIKSTICIDLYTLKIGARKGISNDGWVVCEILAVCENRSFKCANNMRPNKPHLI